MVKKIMRDPLFLAQKSTDATEADQQVITDLLDTLRANLDHCVGMAANMIGVKKNIIVVAAGPFQFAMVNPVITKKTGAFIIKVSTTGMLVPLKADSYFWTVGTRNPDYLVSAGASSLHEAIKLFWTFRVPWDGHTLQEQ